MSWNEASLLRWLGRDPIRRDDAAHLDLAGGTWAVAVDQVVEGVHFEPSTTPRQAGRKLAARNLSDLAASGAAAHHALLSIAADARPEAWMRSFIQGAEAELRTYGARLVGGDLSMCSRGFVASLSIAGPLHGTGLSRTAAQSGETLFVSGPLGGSLLGRHLRIRPRLALAERLVREFGVCAAMDVSDGLALDLERFARASGIGIELEAERVPIHRDAHKLARRAGGTPWEHALFDGEDYELIFSSKRTLAELNAHGLEVHAIGQTLPQQAGLHLRLRGQRVAWPRGGWEHGGA